MAYRKDKDITKTLPYYRQMLAHVTPGRNAAEFHSHYTLNLSKTLPWMKEHFEKTGEKISLVHLFMASFGRGIHRHKNLNRYVQGYRVFERDGVYASVSVKKSIEPGAPVVLLKMQLDEEETGSTIYQKLQAKLERNRQKKLNSQEKEMKYLLYIPGFLLNPLVKFVQWLDRRHWLPGFFADPDPMYTSVVVANVGSVGINAGYHHLYEYGNAPMFAVIGKVEKKAMVVDDQLKIVPAVDMKYTYDERIDDGLAAFKILEIIKDFIEDPTLFEKSMQEYETKSIKTKLMSDRFDEVPSPSAN